MVTKSERHPRSGPADASVDTYIAFSISGSVRKLSSTRPSGFVRWRGKSFARTAPTLAPRTASLSGIIASGPPRLGTLADCIIALGAAERGLARYYRGGPEHRPGYRSGEFTGATSIPGRDARTGCLSSLEEQ